MLLATLFAFVPIYMVKHFIVDETPLVAENLSDVEEVPAKGFQLQRFEHWLHRPAKDWLPDLMVPRDQDDKPRTLDDILSDKGEEGQVKEGLKQLMGLKTQVPDLHTSEKPRGLKHKRKKRSGR